MRYRCPTDEAYFDGGELVEHTVIGCGAEFDAEPDEEGLIDCPACGIWFNPAKER